MARTPEHLQQRRRERRRRQIQRRRAVALLALLGAGAGAYTLATAGGQDPHRGTTGTTSQSPAPAPADPAPSGTRIRITAVGDIMMGTPQFGLPPDGGRGLFTAVTPMLAGDVVIGNLEGTLTTRGGSKCGAGSTNCYAFRSPPSYVGNLARAGFTVVNLANNHAYDFGEVGQADTLANLSRAGIAETGRPGRYAVVRAGEARVAVLGFSTYRWANRMTELGAAKAMVRRASAEADVVVVVMHGGAEGRAAQHVRPGTEMFLGENRGDVMAFSRAMVDAGADLVVGHGPHVLRAMEFRKGRLIAYSLGNFVGWKGFSLAGASGVTGVLNVTLNADGTYVGGRLRPAVLVGSGAPAPGGPAVRTVRDLTRQDLGARGAVLGADGTIRPPATR